MIETLTVERPQQAIPAGAFDELFRSSASDVHAYVASLVRDPGLAEEVTAVAFERAFRRRRLYRPRRGTPRQWLFGIARNAALDELRRDRRRGEQPAVETADWEDLDDAAERSERRGAVAAALAALAPADRELVALKFFAGLTNAEIAGILRISESNAGTRIHRVLTQLREQCHVA